MGSVLGKFKKKPLTRDILETLEKACGLFQEIQATSEYKRSTEKAHKHLVGSLILYSVLLYVLAAVVFYFWFFPSTFSDGVLHSLPLIIFPVLILILKRLLHWYFTRAIKRNEEQLTGLKKKKKSILDEVMNNETYRVAKELLEKFDPELLKKQENYQETHSQNGSGERPTSNEKDTELRHRSNVTPRPPLHGQHRAVTEKLVPVTPYTSVTSQRNGQFAQPVRPPTPRPILSQQRNVFDRFVDYMVGDGPSNRYALICRRCNSHNGMALKEEFEYIGFRCCYCFQVNPARKYKPHAPKLSETQPSSEMSDHGSSDVSGSEEVEEQLKPKDNVPEEISDSYATENNRVCVEQLESHENKDIVDVSTISTKRAGVLEESS
ncbi:protein lunapark-A-like isoform X3 [Limulus polyphemus]|uniref:Endoplasmic reticulum junction formation protein lunapark n=1 Tax=Limulus polyphemus TaxID=6850 RepID=A0ABM1SR76_LIMPO|nr:protein lunapark-A-like isoform X3 [Limulus polyphemus]